MTGGGVQRVALDAPHVCLKMMRVNSTETGGSSFSLSSSTTTNRDDNDDDGDDNEDDPL